MRRKIATTVAGVVLALAGFGVAPSPSGVPSPLVPAQAAVTKSLNASGQSGGNVSGAGHRLGGLLSGWAVPVLIVLGGCLLIGALTQRNIGAGVGIVIVTLVGLIFLLSPQSIESLAKGIASVVF
jgi:hypothetical protein